MAEMRRLLDVLRAEADEPELGPAPGLASINTLVERVRGAGLQLEFEQDGQPHGVAPGLDLAAYRIVQEALTNVLKHAPGAHAKLVLRYNTSGIDIEVRDDGQGVRANADGSGRGLIGMHERVALYGGALEAGPVVAGGFRVHAELPRAG
jgi:signal transduction histidine kinase